LRDFLKNTKNEKKTRKSKYEEENLYFLETYSASLKTLKYTVGTR
jgi:hypothetical protein